MRRSSPRAFQIFQKCGQRFISHAELFVGTGTRECCFRGRPRCTIFSEGPRDFPQRRRQGHAGTRPVPGATASRRPAQHESATYVRDAEDNKLVGIARTRLVCSIAGAWDPQERVFGRPGSTYTRSRTSLLFTVRCGPSLLRFRRSCRCGRQPGRPLPGPRPHCRGRLLDRRPLREAVYRREDRWGPMPPS